MRVEFLLAYDDRTWDTEVFELPGLHTWDGNTSVFDRFVGETLKLARYRKVVGMFLYACPADDQDDRPLYWSSDDGGWVERGQATEFTQVERDNSYNLPERGSWRQTERGVWLIRQDEPE